MELVIEIYAGEGGKDAKNFVHELASIYSRYAAKKNLVWLLDHSDESNVMFRVSGNGVEKAFKNEAGKHVIQRVPVTERNGRKQTSVVSVAVMPLPPDTVKGLLPENELETKCQCGGGPGGQSVNKTASTVRMKHIPTGLSVIIMNERNQDKNKRLAHRILSAKVADLKNGKLTSDYNLLRREQLGGGSRGDKVRTYNIMESRVVDHRLGTKTSNVKEIMKGNLDLILEA